MHVQTNRTHTRVHLYCTHSISGIQHMVYQILIKVVQKHESHSLGFQIMPFTENTLALANMCLVIHVMGNVFNIKNCRTKIEFTHNTHTQLLQKHVVNRYHIHTMYI